MIATYWTVSSLLLCWLGLSVPVFTANFSCVTSGASQVLWSDGPLISSTFYNACYIATDVLFQTSVFELTSAIQVTAVLMFPRQHIGTLTVRAALYDISSTLIAQTLLTEISAAGFLNAQIQPLTLLFDQPVNLTAGVGYSVSYWYANSSNAGDGYFSLFCTSPANATLTLPVANFATVNGSFPIILATSYILGDGTSAPFIQLMGSPCTNTIPAISIRLNETVLTILKGIRSKYNHVPAIGVSIIQMPSLQSYTEAPSPANAICPFIPVSTVVTGIRRTDAVTPESTAVTDQWHLGSNTKSMTAILIHMLIQAGKINLTTTVGQLFPYLPFTLFPTPPSNACTCANFSNAIGYFAESPYSCGLAIHTSWQHITVAHLLTHSSGLEALDTAVFPGSSVFAQEFELERNGTTEACTNYSLPSRRYHLSQLLSMIVPTPPSSINDSAAYYYSNNNHILLGLILEEIWHLPWEVIIQQQLFDPLGMATAGFGSPIEQMPLTSFATQPFGHVMDTAGVLHSTDTDNLKLLGPAGTVHASLNDWAKFIACHLQEGRDLRPFGYVSVNNSTNSSYLLSPFMWQSIHTAYSFPSFSIPISEYSLSGMLSYGSNLGLTLEHDGSNTLWYAVVRAYPRLAQPVAFLIATNVLDANAVSEASIAIVKAYLAWQQQGQPSANNISTTTLSLSAWIAPATLDFGLSAIVFCVQLFLASVYSHCN
jgi:CubicO group peptidase (beta-lactamase class C family)